MTSSDYLNLNSLHCLLYILYNFTFENLVFDQKNILYLMYFISSPFWLKIYIYSKEKFLFGQSW